MLHQYERLILLAMKDSKLSVKEIASHSKLNEDSVMRAIYWLEEKGAVKINKKKETEFKLGEEGAKFLKEGFPEIRILQKAREKEVEVNELNLEEKGIGLPWAKRNNWVELLSRDGKAHIRITGSGEKILREGYDVEVLLKKIKNGERVEENELLTTLLKRGEIIKQIEKSEIEAQLTKKGAELREEARADVERVSNVLTKELITTGKWRDVKLREYDVKAPVERITPGKKHPLRCVIDAIRRIFLEMGFEEMEDNLIESSFWNFDALFQPQDHPARDLMDTFYLSAPEKIPLPKNKIVGRVKQAHEKAWKYKWREDLAELAILRTHDTAVSPKYMLDIWEGRRKAPAKYFSVGRVYRNEATDYKHLSEFHQVGGIIVDENATFRDLLGLLKEFFRKLGFEKIRFRPSYFPYTEPSLEVEVFYEKKKTWLELGGAGIFRPEVCLPAWGKYPVLAWGISLERPTMLMMDLDDIRMFYKNDVNWLRDTKAAKLWV
jgi:phenylalanyl-tRNA synthetase alpha chain